MLWKKNKTYIIITSLVTLIPILIGIFLWKQLPGQMATHFGANNEPNGWSSKGFVVFGMPLILLVIHLLCTLATSMDPRSSVINQKVYKLVLLIAPAVSLLCAATIYSYALGSRVNMELIAEVFIGFLFVILGNYLPKCRRNYTVGIRIPWTLDDEENWNRTHRLAGWIWVPCGLIVIINAFLRLGAPYLLFLLMAAMVLIPVAYSFWYYMAHRQR